MLLVAAAGALLIGAWLRGITAGSGAAPAAAAAISRPSAPVIEETVKSYLDQWQPMADPLITLDNGLQVKASNVRGIEIEGQRYYYRLMHDFSADPVSRGIATNYEVVSVLDPGTEWETQIYRIR